MVKKDRPRVVVDEEQLNVAYDLLESFWTLVNGGITSDLVRDIEKLEKKLEGLKLKHFDEPFELAFEAEVKRRKVAADKKADDRAAKRRAKAVRR